MIVQFEINKEKYQIHCEEGEETKIFALAKKVDSQIKKLAPLLKKPDNKSLLALYCIMAQSEIDKAQKNDEKEEIDDAEFDKLIAKIDSVAKKIEAC